MNTNTRIHLLDHLLRPLHLLQQPLSPVWERLWRIGYWPRSSSQARGVFGRAFAEAYKQAQASSAYAREAGKGNTAGANNVASSGLTLDEACKILNVKPPMGGITNMENVMERFKKLYDVNEPKNGGSFYLQSKVLRARERIEMEVREAERKMAAEKDLKEGWKPKMYRD